MSAAVMLVGDLSQESAEDGNYGKREEAGSKNKSGCIDAHRVKICESGSSNLFKRKAHFDAGKTESATDRRPAPALRSRETK